MKAAYQVRPELCVTLANLSVAMCLSDGNTEDSAIGYMVHGAIFRGGVLGQHAAGHAWGRLALALVEQQRAQLAEVSFVVGYFATAWRRPAEEAEALFERALSVGLETHDDFHVGCAAAGLAMSRTMRGAPPSEIIEHGERHLALLHARHQRETAATVAACVALARRRRDGSLMPAGEDDEALARYGSRHFAHFQLLCRALAAHEDGDDARARAVLDRAEAFLPDARGMLHAAEHVFVRALVAAPGDPRRAIAAARFAGWARHQPENFAAKAALLAALVARDRLPRALARAALERAARVARETGRPHVAALAARLR